MFTRSRSVISIVLVVMTIAGIANAKPDWGQNCAECHALQSGHIQVTGNDTTAGGLKTFIAAPGDTVALTVNVTGGGGKYALQMIGLDSGGQNNSSNNLSYVADSTWTRYTTGGLCYTKSGSATGVQSFNVTINSATPGDLYKLTFGIGFKSGGLGYQTEDFYLQVQAATPQPDPIISGSVTTADATALSGVLLTATGGLTATTNASGVYSITVGAGFSGTITPSKTDYTFSPASGSYSNVTADQSNANYTGQTVVVTPATYTISGNVLASDGTGISSAIVSTTSNGGSAVTDAAGFYTITVSEGWSGTLTVSKADYTIEPASGTYTNVTADIANENYLATAVGGGDPSSNPVISAEIHQAIDYNDPAIADDTAYVFYFEVETDSTVNRIDVLTPAGNTFQIVSDAHTQAAGVETWHLDNLGTHVWAYEATYTDAASLDNFGDGTYTVTASHGVSDQSRTDILFAVADSSEAIAQPNQEPVITAPAQNTQVTSPVTVEWEPYIEAIATSIRLELASGNGSIIANDYTVDAAASAPLTPADGIYNGRLSFENSHQSANADGIPVTAVKYSESDFSFEVQADTGGDPGNGGGGDSPTGQGQEVIVDNSDAGASSTGTWKTSSGKHPHGVNSVWSKLAGDTFTFQADLAQDRYAVFMWWTEWPNRMTNAPVEILNNGTSLGTVSVSQKLTGGQWNLLGIYDLGGIAGVTITSNGPGSTNADAVRFLPLSQLDNLVIDNGAPGTSSTGSWKTSGGKNPYARNSLWSKDTNATYTFESPLTGKLNLYAWWTVWGNRRTNVPVEIRDGSVVLATVYINQKANGGQWNYLGSYDFADHAVVTVLSKGAGTTNADAIKFDTGPTPEDTGEYIIDNGSVQTSSTGTWKNSGGKGPYGTSSLWSKTPGDTYTFALRQAGTYEVYARWTLWPSRLSSVPVEIRDGDSLLETVSINQTANGTQWNYLGRWTFADSPGVTIVSQGPGSTNADAVKFVKIDNDPGDNNNTDPDDNTDPGDNTDQGTGDVDVITVEKSRYKVEDEELRIEVTSSDQPNAVLTVEGFGEMIFKDDKYRLRLKPVDYPGDTVTVTSTSGASITIDVEIKD